MFVGHDTFIGRFKVNLRLISPLPGASVLVFVARPVEADQFVVQQTRVRDCEVAEGAAGQSSVQRGCVDLTPLAEALPHHWERFCAALYLVQIKEV